MEKLTVEQIADQVRNLTELEMDKLLESISEVVKKNNWGHVVKDNLDTNEETVQELEHYSNDLQEQLNSERKIYTSKKERYEKFASLMKKLKPKLNEVLKFVEGE